MRIKKRDIEEKLSPEGRILDQFLFQYKDCVRIKRRLEKRRNEIVMEFDLPLSGVNYDGMPTGTGISNGSAAISLRLDEIDTKIRAQIDKSIEYLNMIMDMLNLLPESSLERAVLESRYIDGLKWERLSKENFVSRSKAIRYWKRGLYRLLEDEYVKNIMNKLESEGAYKKRGGDNA